MKKRVISACIAITLVVPLVILGGIYFAVGAGLIATLAYKEVIDLKEGHGKIPGLVKILGLISMLLLIYFTFDGYSFAFGVSYQALGIAFLLLLVPTIFYHHKGVYSTKDAFFMLGFVILLGLFFNSLILIVDYNKLLLVLLILIPMVSDTFAYFTGRLIGKHKVTEISPKKSLEGYVGGTLIGTFVGTLFYLNLINSDMILWKLILMVFSLSIIGSIGDLFFSKVKRENGIKDFSNLMPGHGGILDRLDALIFVVLTYIILFGVL